MAVVATTNAGPIADLQGQFRRGRSGTPIPPGPASTGRNNCEPLCCRRCLRHILVVGGWLTSAHRRPAADGQSAPPSSLEAAEHTTGASIPPSRRPFFLQQRGPSQGGRGLGGSAVALPRPLWAQSADVRLRPCRVRAWAFAFAPLITALIPFARRIPPLKQQAAIRASAGLQSLRAVVNRLVVAGDRRRRRHGVEHGGLELVGGSYSAELVAAAIWPNARNNLPTSRGNTFCFCSGRAVEANLLDSWRNNPSSRSRASVS